MPPSTRARPGHDAANRPRYQPAGAAAHGLVSITVVLELEWLLRSAYRLERAAVIALEALMAIRQVHLERQALAWHQEGLDFADALHLLGSEA